MQTIYSLVEQVPTNAGHVNFLFLTNSQASEFDFSNVSKVMNAMEISPSPKLIVTIFKSRVHVGSTPRRNGFPTINGSRNMFSNRVFVGENGKQDLRETEQRMALFLKEQLMPVCIKTRALVFLHDTSCSVSTAFGDLCQTEKSRRNGVLPFTVMCVAGAQNIQMRAENDDNSLARQLRRGSRRWKQYNTMLVDVHQEDAAVMETTADFPQGLTHVVLVSSVNEEKQKRDKKPLKVFKSNLVDRLSKDLPSVGICSYSFGGDPFSLYAEYVGRHLPLILIDTRPRHSHDTGHGSPQTKEGLRRGSISATKKGATTASLRGEILKEAKAHLEAIDSGLAANQSWNFFEASTLGYLHSLMEEFMQSRLQMESGMTGSQEAGSRKSQWLYMSHQEKKRLAVIEGDEGLFEEDPEHLLAKGTQHLCFSTRGFNFTHVQNPFV